MVAEQLFPQQQHLNHWPNQGEDALLREIWKVCSGSSLDVSKAGESVYYLPKLHAEQFTLGQSSNQELIERLQLSNIPPKILCRVLGGSLLVEPETEEVYAEIKLSPNQDQEYHSLQQNEPTAPDFSLLDPPPRPQFQLFCKKLTKSDIKGDRGLSVPLKDAVKCFPPLDMGQEKPTQELIAKDLLGNEWRFKHAYQGRQRRHSLRNCWIAFVTSKKLLAGDLVVFLRDEPGKLHVAIRRLSYPCCFVGASTFSRQSMEGVLADVSQALATRSSFIVYQKPCYNKSIQFIMSASKYFEGGNNGCGVGIISRMQHGGEDSHVRRTNDLDQISLSQGQQTTNLLVEEDQHMQELEVDCAQPTMMDMEIRQQTVGSHNNNHCFAPAEDNGLQLHAAVVRENNEGSIPNETVAIQAQAEEVFKELNFPDSTNTSLDTIALGLDCDGFRSTLQDFGECLEEQQETISPHEQNSLEDHSRRTSSVSEHPTSSQVMSIPLSPSQFLYEGPGGGDEKVPWRGYQVARRTLPILSRVVSRYPDSLVNFKVAGSILQSANLETLAGLVYSLDNLTIVNLSKDQLRVAKQHICDLKLSGIEIGWLEKRLLHIEEVFRRESLLERQQEVTRRIEETLATYTQLDEELGRINKEFDELSLKVGPNPSMRLQPVLEGLL